MDALRSCVDACLPNSVSGIIAPQLSRIKRFIGILRIPHQHARATAEGPSQAGIHATAVRRLLPGPAVCLPEVWLFRPSTLHLEKLKNFNIMKTLNYCGNRQP